MNEMFEQQQPPQRLTDSSPRIANDDVDTTVTASTATATAFTTTAFTLSPRTVSTMPTTVPEDREVVMEPSSLLLLSSSPHDTTTTLATTTTTISPPAEAVAAEAESSALSSPSLFETAWKYDDSFTFEPNDDDGDDDDQEKKEEPDPSSSSNQPQQQLRRARSVQFQFHSTTTPQNHHSARRDPSPATTTNPQLGWNFDMSTGIRTLKRQVVEPVRWSKNASDQKSSQWNNLRNKFINNNNNNNSKSSRRIVEDEPDHNPSMQIFRIRSSTAASSEDSFLAWKHGYEMGDLLSYLISESLRWTFRQPFLVVGIMAYVCFVILFLFFALLVYGTGRYQPQCINVNGENFTAAGTDFMDAIQLSWTTLSTVGLGIVAPGLPSSPAQSQCYGINALMAVESFVGVLFGAIMGSIIFAKIVRVQSVAPVQFSDPLVIRYGCGVMETGDDAPATAGEMPADDDDDDDDDRRIPCPVLEFRILNELSAAKGGEILDAGINVVGVTLEKIDEAERLYYQLQVRQARTKQNKTGETSSSDLQHGVVAREISKHDATTTNTHENECGERSIKPRSTSIVGKAAHSTAHAASLVARGMGKGVGSTGTVAAKVARGVGSTASGAAKVVAKGATLGATNAAMGATTIAKTTGAALLGAGQIASHATGNLIQRVNHTLMKGHSMDIPSTEEMDMDPVNKAREEQRQFEEELERRYAEKLAEQLRARDQSLGVSAINAARTSVTVDEGNSKLAPPQIYHKLEMETDSHPFFKRVWNIRHRLNEESPLLSRTARKMIAENGGYWPEELNNHKSIRKHLQFTELIGR